MKVSVILPVYNAEKYVSAAVESILKQTFTDFELLLVNDASTDGSRAVLSDFAACDPRIRLIDNPKNMGLTATLNKAIDLCRGEYIARMDADDIALPERLAIQVDFLDKQPEIGFCGSWVAIIDAQGNPTGERWAMQLTPEAVHARMYFHNCFVHASVMMRRRYALMKYDAANYPIQEDYEFWTRLTEATKGFVIPKILLYYRIHGENITLSKAEKARLFTRQIVRNRLQRLGLNPSEEELDLHFAVGDQQVSPDPAFIAAVHDWLLQLWQAFTRHYGEQPALQQAMRQLIGKFWLAILTQRGIAPQTAGAYAFSPLSEHILSLGQRLRIRVKNLF